MKNSICFISLLVSMISISGYSVDPIVVPHRDIHGSVPIITNTVEYVTSECTNVSLNVFNENADYVLTNLSNDTEIRLYSGQIATVTYNNSVNDLNIIIDISDKDNYRSSDILMVLNSKTNGLMTIRTKSYSTTIPCIIKKKKSENPLEIKAGNFMYMFSKVGYDNGSNVVFVSTQEIE